MMASETTNRRRVRPAAVAGRFYPGDPRELADLVNSFLAQAPRPTGPAPKALIVPHAGYIYSGPIAASAYAQLVPARDQVKRVVLLGPSHYVQLDGLAASSADAFATPLGTIRVDLESVSRVRSLPQVAERDDAHSPEHSLEVQLPFLQTVLGNFSLVPLTVGEATAEEVRQVLDELWGGPETRFVISSDLSHYHDAETARILDGATAQAIESLQPDSLAEQSACGRIAIQGLLEVARHHRLRAHTMDLRNSGDTAGPRDRVVGYGAFAFAQG
jgi:AmmeMemoRadiSam system protein B